MNTFCLEHSNDLINESRKLKKRWDDRLILDGFIKEKYIKGRLTILLNFEISSSFTKSHLRTIDSKHYSLIRTSIEKNLQFEPDIETTNRKPLKRQVAFEAEWELRFAPDSRFRVFYDIDMTSHAVHILAIGEKNRNRLVIGGKEIKL